MLGAMSTALGGFYLWLCIVDLLQSYVTLPAGRHSSIVLQLSGKSPALFLALFFHTGFILFFGGVGMLMLKDAMRAEPRLGDGFRRSD